MTNKKSTTTPASALFAEWRNDPEYVRAYEALDEEFSLAAAMIAARSHAGLTQKELAERMGTTQSVVARLEGGNSRPSTATLDKFAQATGTRLRISFEPDARPS
jgi:ribosome-binding protein aMBF1 (putative translation factor)